MTEENSRIPRHNLILLGMNIHFLLGICFHGWLQVFSLNILQSIHLDSKSSIVFPVLMPRGHDILMFSPEGECTKISIMQHLKSV